MQPILTIVLIFIQGINWSPIQVAHFTEIPIYVEDTREITYASDIQDISLDWYSGVLMIRSNGDGRIYLADPDDCSYLDEINLPTGADGFGVAFCQGEYYINSSSSNTILHSDGSDSWNELENPAGNGGAGMDFEGGGAFSDLLCEVSANSPYQFHCIETDGTGSESFLLPGVDGEISGFMGHDVMTLSGNPPFAVILTTRFGHEFYFYWKSGGNYVQYGQEPCPVPVLESLGLAWSPDNYVYWSYRGVDGKYYISSLAIPVFGDIEEETVSLPSSRCLGISESPSRGSALLTMHLLSAGFASLEIYDTSGRLMEELYNGQTAEGEVTFSFSGPPGLYFAVLRYPGMVESLRFVLIGQV